MTVTSGAPRTKPRLARYAAWPLSDAATRASGPSSTARRRPSALATPWPVKRTEPSASEPPSKLASPPNRRALPPTTVKSFCVKSTRPRAPASSGLSGPMRTSLPVSVRPPFTLVPAAFSSGTTRPSFRSAAPLPVLAASALPSQPPTGVVLTNCSISANGPCAAASSDSTGSASRPRTANCTWLHSTLPTRARPLRTSSTPWSRFSSALARVSTGHGRLRAGAALPVAGLVGASGGLGM